MRQMANIPGKGREVALIFESDIRRPTAEPANEPALRVCRDRFRDDKTEQGLGFIPQDGVFFDVIGVKTGPCTVAGPEGLGPVLPMLGLHRSNRRLFAFH
jgi:hypothetical protein